MNGPKYKHYYNLMLTNNTELFETFSKIHQEFSTNPEKWADQFHSVGRDVKDVMRDWERRLCSGTEKGTYAQYSSKLAEKFWGEIKKNFPLIDEVGLIKK
ncbi:MAG: hypothetical protein QG639_832 [Patescibacteria group bacterium]|nr:hypothetical protein [Patescibacteria group bacterium]